MELNEMVTTFFAGFAASLCVQVTRLLPIRVALALLFSTLLLTSLLYAFDPDLTSARHWLIAGLIVSVGLALGLALGCFPPLRPRSP